LNASSFKNQSIFSDIEKVVIVDYFIRQFIIDWTDDKTTQGISDHVPLPDEALKDWSFNSEWMNDVNNKSFRAHDDCDGIAVVTVSLIRRLMNQDIISGQAYIASGTSHWFTAVKVNDTTPFIFLNHWRSVHIYCIYRENSIPIYGQNLLKTFSILIVLDRDDKEEYLIYADFIQSYFGVLVVLVILMSFILSAIATIFLGYPRNYDIQGEKNYVKAKMARFKKKSRFLKALYWLFVVKINNPFSRKYLFNRRHIFFWINSLVMTAMLSMGVLLLYYIAFSPVAYTYASIFTYFYIFMLVFVLDRDYPVRLFKRIYKSLKKQEFEIYPKNGK
ncbi:MAG: hypothetical protein ACTSRA_20435, partial [Promethearchaeota archaeon]